MSLWGWIAAVPSGMSKVPENRMFRNFQIGAKCYVVFTLLRVWNMKKVKHYTMKIE